MGFLRRLRAGPFYLSGVNPMITHIGVYTGEHPGRKRIPICRAAVFIPKQLCLRSPRRGAYANASAADEGARCGGCSFELPAHSARTPSLRGNGDPRAQAFPPLTFERRLRVTVEERSAVVARSAPVGSFSCCCAYVPWSGSLAALDREPLSPRDLSETLAEESPKASDTPGAAHT